MKKRLIAKIFIALSVIFILTLCGIYGYRLVHYYRLEHPKTEVKERLLWTTVADLNKVVSTGDGLYKESKEYYYKGNPTDNYVKYSGIMWRIVKIDENNNVTMISDESLTSMVLGYEANDFKTSYGYNYLDTKFYEQLHNADQYIVESSYCVDAITDSADVKCSQRETSKVGMMSVYEYLKATGSKSYLNNGKTFWTVNPNEDYKFWFVNQNGLVSSESRSGESYHSYGIRPVITIKGETKILAGLGSKEEPYRIDEVTSNELKEQTIGSYVSYSNQVWKIVEVNDLGVKIVLNGYLKVGESELIKAYSSESNLYSIRSTDNLGYYLNSTYYNSLSNKEYLVEYPWRNYYYNSTEKFDYQGKSADVVKTEVGLLQVSDLFITDFEEYALMNPSNEDDETVFTILKDGRLYANAVTKALKVRPAVVLKINLNVTGGTGTEADPFQIGA